MKRKLLITISLLSAFGLITAAVPIGISIAHAINAGGPREISSDITPTKPGRGETVSFLPNSLSSFMQMDDLLNTYKDKANEIGELTSYCDELASWQQHMSYFDEAEKDIRRELFKKYDLFPPTNNILSWDSKINAKSYRVIISQDKSFETIEREYIVTGSEDSVIFDNPYTGTDYYWQVIATKNDDSLVYSDIFNFTVANLPRTVLIEGVSNTRDIGGNVGFNGKKVKQGLLYRGMGLEAITTQGINELKYSLGINTEIDLRGVNEGLENYLSLSNYYHCPSPFDYYTDFIINYSINNTGSDSLLPSFGNALKALANKDNYPAYFHCSVGRDRTGWLSMCLNLLCGVSEEAVLKELCLSLFSTVGALTKGHLELYNRYHRIRDYINTFDGDSIHEKLEDYLVKMTGVTHEECENIRKILLGDVEIDFKPGKVNEDSYTDLARVSFRKYGETPIIKLVEVGSLLTKPEIYGNGDWYYGDRVWDFEHDIVYENMNLDYLSNDKCKVAIHYSGIDLPDDVLDVDYETILDFSIFDKDGYTYKVYDDSFNGINSLVVNSDVSINVVYSPVSGYIPKSNSRIIVMAGQSNGAGVGHYEYLPYALDEEKIAEINNGYENVLITGYSHQQFIEGFRKVYANKRTSTAGQIGTFGYEVGLADRLSKVFPDETTYIVKYAYGGTSLNYDWASPTIRENVPIVVPHTETEERGWLYTGLEKSLTEAISYLSETTNTIPMVEAFMWMQGEADADLEISTSMYLSSFNTLVDDFKTKFADNISYKFTVYDAAISETSIWPFAEQMNEIKRSRVDEKNVYIETNDRLTTRFEPIGTYSDEAHYDAACYIDLGHMFADAYLSKTIKGYTHNTLEIGAPSKIIMKKDVDYHIDSPIVYFNGEPVPAKLSYFAYENRGYNDIFYTYFTVNDDNSFTPTRVGNTQLRITAYYHDEVRTVLVPVEIVS